MKNSKNWTVGFYSEQRPFSSILLVMSFVGVFIVNFQASLFSSIIIIFSNEKIPVCFISKFLSNHTGDRPFIYYVITFSGFLDPPPPYVSMFLVLKIINNWHFLTPLPPLQVIT